MAQKQAESSLNGHPGARLHVEDGHHFVHALLVELEDDLLGRQDLPGDWDKISSDI